MTNRPSEEEQVNIVKKNFLPHVRATMGGQYYPHFRALREAGVEIKEGLGKTEVQPKKVSGQFTPRKYDKPVSAAVSTINNISQPTTSWAPESRPVPVRREYTELHAPLSKVYQALLSRNLIKPLDPRPLPNPLPRNFKTDAHCAFHQTAGHTTDQCFHLRNIIQDLIDRGTIAPPANPKPDTTHNPLPNHANAIFLEENPEFDPSTQIIPIHSPKPLQIFPYFLLHPTSLADQALSLLTRACIAVRTRSRNGSMKLSEVLNQLLEFGLKLPSQMSIDCQRFSTLFLEARKWARESDSWVVPTDEVSLDDVV